MSDTPSDTTEEKSEELGNVEDGGDSAIDIQRSGTENPDRREFEDEEDFSKTISDGEEDGSSAYHHEDEQQEDGISGRIGVDWLGLLPAFVLFLEVAILVISVYLGDARLMQAGRSVGGVLRTVYEASGLEVVVLTFGPVITIAILVGVINLLSGLIIAGTKIERDQEPDSTEVGEPTKNDSENGVGSTITRRLGYGLGALSDAILPTSAGSNDPSSSGGTAVTAQTNGGSSPAANGGTTASETIDGPVQPDQPQKPEEPSIPASTEDGDSRGSEDDESLFARAASHSEAYKMVQEWRGARGEDDDEEIVDLDEKDDELISMATENLGSRDEPISLDAIRQEVTDIEKQRERSEVEGRAGVVTTPSERTQQERLAVAPEEIEESKTYVTRTGRDGRTKFGRVLIVSNYPARVPPGWVDELFTRGLNTNSASLRISYHINPRDTSTMIKTLSTRVTRLMMGISDKRDKGKTNIHEEQQQLQQVKRLRDRLSKGETKMFDFAFYLEVTADDKQHLNEGTEELRNHFGRVAGQVTPLYDRQLEAQQSMAPLGTDTVRNTQIMDLEAMGTTFPFVDPSLVQPEGVLMGFHQQTSSPVVVDRYQQSGHNMLISGKIGSGKSYLAKLSMWRRLMIDSEVEVLIIDPVGGFGSTVDSVGGQQVVIGSDTIINPMEIREVEQANAKELESNPYDDKLRSLMGMFQSEFQGKRELDKREEGVLRRAIRLAYLSKGITKDLETHSNQSPTIQKVLDILDELSSGNHPESFLDVPDQYQNLIDAYSGMNNQGGAKSIQKAADSVGMGLEMFRQGGSRSNLNGNTNVQLQDRIVQFDISNIADGSSESLYMHIILDWLFQRAKGTTGRTVVNIDEAHYMLGQEQALGMLNLFARHSRHYNTGLTLISQTVDEFMGNEQAKEIYDQCDIRALMRHEDLGKEAVKALDLTERDRQFVLQAQAGNSANYSECLMYATDGGKMRLNIKSNEYEHYIVEEDLNAYAYAFANGWIDESDMDEAREQEVKYIIRETKRKAEAD